MSTDVKDTPEEIVEDPVQVDESKLDQSGRDALAAYRRELKRHRERAEVEAKKRAEIESDREKVRRERDELGRFKAEREKKDLEDQGRLQELVEREREERRKELSEAHRLIILSKAETLAQREGIIDPDDVEALDISDLRLDGKQVPGLAEKIAALKAAKPHYFRQTEQKPDERKRPAVPPERKDSSTTDRKDWSRAKDGEVREELRKYGVTF